MNDITKKYISSLLDKSDELYTFKNTEKAKDVPAITDEALSLIKVIISSANVKNILEIGTATGSSSMFFSEFVGDEARITTIERDDAYFLKANRNIENYGFSDKIIILKGDAKTILSELDSSYDMIFLDGAKAQYINMLDNCIRLLKTGGILIADNVLFRGMVSGENPVLKRKITIVKRLRQFLTEITHRDDLISTVLDIGDGVSISVKKS